MGLPYFTHAAQIFASVVQAHADEKALLWSAEECTSFERLDRFSNQVACLLLERRVRKRDTVCICLEKSLLAYGAILACLKIGATYFVVDPANPPARTRAIVDCCKPALAFITTSVPAECFDCDTVAADGESLDVPSLAGFADGPIAVPWEIDGSDPAYVMFTSGSTGMPKGATISQSNLVNFIQWSRNQFNTQPDDVFTNLNPLFFDNSVFDIYSSLFAGASLVPFNSATMRNPHEIVSRIDEFACTVFFSVPSLLIYLQTLKLVDRKSFPSLRKVIFGGEGYPKPMLARLHDSVGRRIELYNVYGPTECTCICSVYRISDADFVDLKGYPPLGRLIPNFSHVIIDDLDARVEPGEVGELCLGGPCIGLGYYGAPEQTTKAFVQNPTHDRFFDRVYKTGDLVRYDPGDGIIHFVGRTDSQIKHQGYRIELGEIEHALALVEGVDEAAAVYAKTGGSGRIMAVVASKHNLMPLQIRDAMTHALPKYMIPEKVFVVRKLMKNANGKIDRNAIAASIVRGEL